MNALSARALCFGRNGRPVLDAVDCCVHPGETVGILGANGAGKSTLLSLLSGELAAESGQITLNGAALENIAPGRLARMRAVLPQETRLSFNLKVAEVLAMGAYPFPELSPEQLDALCAEAAEAAEITALLTRPYPMLSGGEQKRVQFARVLVQLLAGYDRAVPRFLLLDEPTASLDPRHQSLLIAVVRRLAQNAQIGVMLVLHDVNLAAAACSKLLFLHNARVLADGAPTTVLRPEIISQVYDYPAQVFPHPAQPERPLVIFGPSSPNGHDFVRPPDE